MRVSRIEIVTADDACQLQGWVESDATEDDVAWFEPCLVGRRLAMQLVDEVKRQLPVWKRQVFPDGSDEWVDCP